MTARYRLAAPAEIFLQIVRPNAHDPEEWTTLGSFVRSPARRPPNSNATIWPLESVKFVPAEGIDLDAYDLEAILEVLEKGAFA